MAKAIGRSKPGGTVSSAAAAHGKENKARRKAIPQVDIPSLTLEEAIRVPKALGDEYAFAAASPLDTAKAVGMQPGSGPFRTLLSASAAYGLTEGSAWAEKITVTQLGRRIVRPTEEGDDTIARREAFMKPRIPREFLKRYDGNKVPREDIARNVLEAMAVPATETARVFKQILSDADRLDLLTAINGVEYVRLGQSVRPKTERLEETSDPSEEPEKASTEPPAATPIASGTPSDDRSRRVYITHGKNQAFVDLLKKFLKYGDMEAVVSVEHETTAMPVPDKVIGEMRTCGAAIIHVDAERILTDADSKPYVVINENVLVEIGAAMALYGPHRFILLVKEEVALPSNLQGLYKVKYKGETLDADAAMRVLEAIADVKNHPLPGLSS
jgi:predicted nucleotide-binding protein